MRGIGLISLISAVAIVGALMALNMQNIGPTSKRVQEAEAQAEAAVSSINFTQAAMELTAHHLENGTYVGGAVTPGSGVTLVRVDVSSFCLQAGVGDSVQHFTGPGGPAAPGPC
jgi:type II secretory pathway pseudopilin PulG